MSKASPAVRLLRLFPIAAAAALAYCLVILLPPPEPRYHGRPLNYWLKRVHDQSLPPAQQDETLAAVASIYVENGVITGRVKDAMVAGNVYETMQNVVAIEDTVCSSYVGRFRAVLFDDVSLAI